MKHFFKTVYLGIAALVFFAGPASGAPIADPEPAPAPEELIWRLQAGEQALRYGFSPVATRIYRSILAEMDPDDQRLPEARLGLASALITERQFEDAGDVLDDYEDLDDPRYLLRRAAIALARRETDEFDGFVTRIETGSLPEEERGWSYFLRAIQSGRQGEADSARELYEQALAASPTVEQIAAFSLAWQRTRLLRGEADEGMAEELKRQMDEFQGRTAGYRFAQQYAVVLEQLGDRAGASSVIRAQIQAIPPAERDLRDQFLLLDGLITGPESGPGRASLRQLLESGGDRELQGIALKTLTATIPEGGWADFDAFLGGLIERENALTETLLLYRAQIALRSAAAAPEETEPREQYERAVSAAEELLRRFPGSGFKQEALEILAAAAWEQRRYRTAAAHLTQLRDDLEPGERRAQTGLLVADCYFRAGEVNRSAEDFRNAADAYGSVARERPEAVSAGRVIFHRVTAEIRGGRVNRAIAHLEEAELDQADSAYRWRAEWNLVKEMQRRGNMEDAYARITRLLGDESETIPDDALRIRLQWLQAQLSHDAGRSGETLPLLDQLDEALDGGALDEPMRDRVKAHSLLLRGKACLAADRDAEGVAALERVRQEYPGSEPAIYSQLVEARHYTEVNRTVDAQQLLIQLADEHRTSPYAPIALYEAALNAQRRGPEESYQQQAISQLERLVNEHPRHELAFYARLRQGDLLRRLNRFEAAELVYRDLANIHPNHPDIALVQLSMADCFLAQATEGSGPRFSNAIAILERLFDLPTISPDLRAEAGFKLAFATARGTNGNRERAGELYWSIVSNLFLNEEIRANLGARGRYWVARSLLEYGRYFEEMNRKEEAGRAYELIEANGLPGRRLAAASLARLRSE